MAKPTLYSLSFSPACMRVFPVLAHKGIDYDNVEVDITKKERPAAFNAVSPFGKVPVLAHDGKIIFESVVINEYLNEVWPKPAMLPADPAARAYARQWIVSFNRAVTDRARHVQRELVRLGQHRGPGVSDLLIAAAAEIHNAVVIHYDRDFDTIAALTGQPVEWIVPAGSVP